MAIHQRKRENLLSDATAYHRRLLIQPATGIGFRGRQVRELFVGQRVGGGWSFYFDESPVMQFNPEGQLRRLYLDQRMLAAAEGQLVELLRPARGGQVRLERQPLTVAEQQAVLLALRELLAQTRSLFQDGPSAEHHVDQYPADDRQLWADCRDMLKALIGGVRIAGNLSH